LKTRNAEGALTQLVAALRTADTERIYLVGSWARGEADELSDLDVVVIKRTTQPFLERLYEVAKLLPADIGAVDVLVYTPEEFAAMQRDENAFAQTVCEEGMLIYGRETPS
jgi:predicted nucleotidyltransferase